MAERKRRHRDPSVALAIYGFLFAAALRAVVQPMWNSRGVRSARRSLQGSPREHLRPGLGARWIVVVIGRWSRSRCYGRAAAPSATRASIVATLEPVVATAVA